MILTFLLLFKLRLGSSADTPEIGDLVLSRLCPALSQVVGNGLKPFLNGFQMFGRVNVTVWKVAEISAEQGEFFQVEAFTQGAPRLNFTVWANPLQWLQWCSFLCFIKTFLISHFEQAPTLEDLYLFLYTFFIHSYIVYSFIYIHIYILYTFHTLSIICPYITLYLNYTMVCCYIHSYFHTLSRSLH